MPLPQKLNIQRAIKARVKGQSYQDIANAQGVHVTTVHQALKPIMEMIASPEQLEQYRANQAAILDTIAARTLASITEDDLQKASLLQKATTTAVLIDKSRLISGQSTQNIGISAFFKSVVESVGSYDGTQEISNQSCIDADIEQDQSVKPASKRSTNKPTSKAAPDQASKSKARTGKRKT